MDSSDVSPPSYSQVENNTVFNNPNWKIWYKKFIELKFNENTAKEYASIFVNNEINVNMISDFNDHILRSIRIEKAGHRIQILKLKPSPSHQNTIRPIGTNYRSPVESPLVAPRCGLHTNVSAVDRCCSCGRYVCIDCRVQREGCCNEINTYCTECDGCCATLGCTIL
ncbi:unnamed protein product [Rotaria sp. Silwood1]|nr:unnamed protein product [Rotaria sp. Silwood1]